MRQNAAVRAAVAVLLAASASGAGLEFGKIGNFNHNQRKVNIRNNHGDRPIVITGVPTQEGGAFFLPRLVSVQKGKFKIRGQEAMCDDQKHAPETVSWMAIPSGPGGSDMWEGTTSGGFRYYAGRLKLTGKQATRKVRWNGLRGELLEPVVLASIQTMNDVAPVMLRVHDIKNNGFTVTMQRHETDTHTQIQNTRKHKEEEIGWFAVAGGMGIAGPECAFSAITSTEHPQYIQHQFTVVAHGVRSKDYVFAALTMMGKDAALLRHSGAGVTLKLRAQEDTCGDVETEHVPEMANVLIVDCKSTLAPTTKSPTTKSPTTKRPTTQSPTTKRPTAEPSVFPTDAESVSGDPFIQAKDGTRVQVFLPVGQEVSLLTCKDMELRGTARASGIAGDHQQWFQQFRVLGAGEEEVAAVAVAGVATLAATDANRTGNLTTIAVTVDGTPWQAPTARESRSGSLIVVSQDTSRPIGNGYAETVSVSMDAADVDGSSSFEIQSTSASKFESRTLQALHAHLDLRFLSLNTEVCTAGVLAEVWGAAPMSAATAAMLHPPSN